MPDPGFPFKRPRFLLAREEPTVLRQGRGSRVASPPRPPSLSVTAPWPRALTRWILYVKMFPSKSVKDSDGYEEPTIAVLLR